MKKKPTFPAAHDESDDWRSVARYYLGDFTDTHSPAECREEAIKRSIAQGKEDALVYSAAMKGLEALQRVCCFVFLPFTTEVDNLIDDAIMDLEKIKLP